ncbi:MAG: preprotein translocase subunit SecG [Bacteroidetes bacterium]|nr:preprotein translocase subunit SecG [Bacteroidota bacterium]
MFGAIITISIIIAVLLVIVVLAQNPKGGGLSAQFGGSGASQLMGVKKTTDFLEKATWVLAISLMVLAMSSKLAFQSGQTGATSPAIERALEQNTLPRTDGFEGLGNEIPTDDGSTTLPNLGDSIDQ